MTLTQAGDSHRYVQWLLYLQDNGYFLIQADVIPSPVVTNAGYGSSVVVLYN